MTANIRWGTSDEPAMSINPALLRRTEVEDVVMLSSEHVENPSNETPTSWPTVPATQLLYLVEDEGDPTVVAAAGKHAAGSPDVIAEVEERYKARTGRNDVVADV